MWSGISSWFWLTLLFSFFNPCAQNPSAVTGCICKIITLCSGSLLRPPFNHSVFPAKGPSGRASTRQATNLTVCPPFPWVQNTFCLLRLAVMESAFWLQIPHITWSIGVLRAKLGRCGWSVLRPGGPDQAGRLQGASGEGAGLSLSLPRPRGRWRGHGTGQVPGKARAGQDLGSRSWRLLSFFFKTSALLPRLGSGPF